MEHQKILEAFRASHAEGLEVAKNIEMLQSPKDGLGQSADRMPGQRRGGLEHQGPGIWGAVGLCVVC
ncbi:hypothetical protein CPLU01_06257 [Colletotrichum plurivorum]|uniref:Uncharacterized protein n=1 Tax=Colletotrichum plurivorum TaxID=2175906 RepID=A0A8H6NGS1_9PEZI|nr:hypothetical protein CPLU01_06257 [Colletotrichum plurivorum]